MFSHAEPQFRKTRIISCIGALGRCLACVTDNDIYFPRLRKYALLRRPCAAPDTEQKQYGLYRPFNNCSGAVFEREDCAGIHGCQAVPDLYVLHLSEGAF